MSGYREIFLGVPVPLPTVSDDGSSEQTLVGLGYEHFTVLLDTERRLAAATAVNIDGGSLIDMGRGDDWHLDERVGTEEQAGPELYRNNSLDRGHLVRRRDPVWGDAESARRANYDTFAYTNAAPQASGFNQSRELWLGLEDHVLDYAVALRHRVSVFTGPVLDAGDPVYRGVGIPRRYWKIAMWVSGVASSAGGGASGGGVRSAGGGASGGYARSAGDASSGGGSGDASSGSGALREPRPGASRAGDGALRDAGGGVGAGEGNTRELRSAAFLLDQTPMLGEYEVATATGDEVPPLGPFRTFQVPVAEVANLTGLRFGPLVAADMLAPITRIRSGGMLGRRSWLPLADTRDIVL